VPRKSSFWSRAQLLGQRGFARDQAAFEKRGADRVVLAPEAEAFLDGAARMADLQVQVPEDVEHGFDHALEPARHLVGREEQEVDVREGRHLAPAVAADGEDGDAFALGRVRARVEARHRDVEHGAHDAVGQEGVGGVGLARGAGAGGEGLRDRGAAGVDGRLQARDGGRPDRLVVGRPGDVAKRCRPRPAARSKIASARQIRA
jgi:hypothetical protein